MISIRAVAELDREPCDLSGLAEYEEQAVRNKGQRPADDNDPAQSSGVMDEGPRDQTAHYHGPGNREQSQSGLCDRETLHTLEIDG
ncbi:uncharacterized protein N7473_000424 [Penicillium subrubescens]|uniref:uncharacterized protein n=1 Tax=Penicillium subrubescens TaxID=1316194 RepID=UPI00254578F0|nr:uncharacterized protein N7473_000424 [Penicillium subrubescens]KAJ5911121.1 hypothetical protein N7473_000424 [Penicillium subrubescens]